MKWLLAPDVCSVFMTNITNKIWKYYWVELWQCLTGGEAVQTEMNWMEQKVGGYLPCRNKWLMNIA